MPRYVARRKGGEDDEARSRWVVPAGVLLFAAAFLGWGLFEFLSVPRPVADSTPNPVGSGPGQSSEGPGLSGVVVSVDPARRAIKLRVVMDDGTEQTSNYDLAEGAKVSADGPAALDELRAGTRVAARLGASGKQIVAIYSEPFRITVTPTQDKVERGEPFNVLVRVTNASRRPQALFRGSSSQSDKQWHSSHPGVIMGPLPGSENNYSSLPVVVNLEPEGATEWRSPMRVTANGRVSFKMGFTLLADGDHSLPSRTYWTPEITINVRPGPKKE